MTSPRRRRILAALASTCTPLFGSVSVGASSLPALKALPKTPRMPVVFVGHGSPRNVITENPWRPQWEALGRKFGSEYPQPAVILCVSAHWLTQGWWITGQAKPKTIHDFGGFPAVMYEQQYPAPGHPQVAQTIAGLAGSRSLELDTTEWGFDHGNWSVMKSMFPRADLPVLQLSMDYSRPPQEHLELARELKVLRDHGVLIIGSGNVVHNLRASQRGAPPDQAYDWAHAFDAWAKPLMEKGDGKTLATFLSMGQLARLAHPSHDHMLPLLHALGAVTPGERVRQFGEGFQSGSISMRSAIWG